MSKMKNPKKAKAKNTLEFRIVIGVVAISIILNILAMALTGGASTYVMGIIAIAIGAIVIALQTELEDTDSKLEVSKLCNIDCQLVIFSLQLIESTTQSILHVSYGLWMARA